MIHVKAVLEGEKSLLYKYSDIKLHYQFLQKLFLSVNAKYVSLDLLKVDLNFLKKGIKVTLILQINVLTCQINNPQMILSCT